jgi:hypothetical protein
LRKPVWLAKRILHFSQEAYFPPDPRADFRIHIEKVDGGSANIREPDNAPILRIAKLLVPPVGAGMKQSREETGIRIEARKIGALLAIAEVTGQRQIVRLVPPAVLPRYDVLDVKREIRVEPLVNSAILTTLIRARANEPFRLLVHYGQARARALSRT